MNIHSTVFQPISADDPYMVVASAFLVGAALPHPAFPLRRIMVMTLHEAIAKCCELACEVRALTEERGHRIQSIRCSHCPTRGAPRCGALAV